MTNKQAQITINAIKFMLDHAQYSDDVEEALDMAINALTAQPEETHDKRTEMHACDCISRQEAIDAISCDITVTGRQNAELVAATIGTFADRIKALPSAQPEQRWIPVSERLPEEEGRYLVTCSKIEWVVDWNIWRNKPKPSWLWEQGVTAWMPLPEPYKGGEQDE